MLFLLHTVDDKLEYLILRFLWTLIKFETCSLHTTVHIRTYRIVYASASTLLHTNKRFGLVWFGLIFDKDLESLPYSLTAGLQFCLTVLFLY